MSNYPALITKNESLTREIWALKEEIARLTAERDQYKGWHRIVNETSESWKDRYFKTQADFAAARAALGNFLAEENVKAAAIMGGDGLPDACYVNLGKLLPLKAAYDRLGTGEALQAIRDAQKILRGDVSAAEYEGEEDTAAKDVLRRLKEIFGE